MKFKNWSKDRFETDIYTPGETDLLLRHGDTIWGSAIEIFADLLVEKNLINREVVDKIVEDEMIDY